MAETVTEPRMTVAVLSDFHTTEKGKSKRILSTAFKAVQELGAAAVLSAGDMVNGCKQTEFDVLKASIGNHLGGIPFYSALGNHDYFSNHPDDSSDEGAREAFFRQMLAQNHSVRRFQNGAYSMRLNGMHILFLDCIQNSRNFRFDEQQAAWLEGELEESRNDRFRIVVNHLPLAAHNLGCKRTVKEFMAGNGKLQRLLDGYGNVIYISGHTHNRIDSEYPSAEQDEHGNVYLNAGSVGNTQPCPLDTERLRPLRDSLSKDSDAYREIDSCFKMGSMGLFLEIHEACISIKGYDFLQRKYIPRCSFTFVV